MDVYAYFKVSACIINEKNRVHSYNLVHDVSSGKYYICDFTNNDPAIEKAQIKRFKENGDYPDYPDGIIFKRTGVQDDQSFGDVGHSVKVKYNNLVNEKDYKITYDVGRRDVYEADRVLTKKKV